MVFQRSALVHGEWQGELKQGRLDTAPYSDGRFMTNKGKYKWIKEREASSRHHSAITRLRALLCYTGAREETEETKGAGLSS